MDQTDTKISLARLYYPVTVLGPGNRIGLWLTGCKNKCPGCISPELQDYDYDKEVSVSDIIRMIASIPASSDGFTISGGEPFYYPEKLYILVKELYKINDDILIFTGYTLDELKEKRDENITGIFHMCSAIIDGKYITELNDGKGLRGSSNQRCHVFKHFKKYAEIETEDRKLQTVIYCGKMLMIGIPGKD